MEQSVLKELQDAQWFLGEERARRENLEREVQAMQQRCRELETQMQDAWQRITQLQKELADTQWFLGEERNRR